MATATKERKRTKTGTVLATDTLRRALGEVAAAVPSRHAKPILTNVLLFNGGLTGTDLELEVSSELPWTGEKLLLPFARLRSIVAECRADEVSISVDGSSAVVSAGHGTWRLPIEDPEEFPVWSASEPRPVCRMPADQFCRACKAVIYATDNESSRYALGAVLIEVDRDEGQVHFVATDGRRLSVSSAELGQVSDPDSRQVLIPARALATIERIAAGHGDTAVQLEATASEVIATIDGTTVTARQIEGRFPRWRDVFPERPDARRHVVEIQQLLGATRAAAIVTSEQSKGVSYTFSETGIHLHGQSAECGEASVTCDIVEPGTPATTKLDPAFLVKFLRALPADGEPNVEIECVDGQTAFVMSCGDVRGVIMPMAAE